MILTINIICYNFRTNKSYRTNMKIIIPVLIGVVGISPLYALNDYRCKDKSLCELHHCKEVTTISDAFSQGKVEGQIRLVNVQQDNDISIDTYSTALGGQLKYETAQLYNTTLAVSSFISQKITPLTGETSTGENNTDILGPNGESLVYLGEAYVEYERKHFDVRVGRQKIDTPLNDRDDVRMLPNTFEAIMAGYGGVEDFIFVGGYITRWAGYDSGPDISQYKSILGLANSGIALAGVMNESIENLELQLWVYNLDGYSRISYTDAVYATEYKSGLSIESGIQIGSGTDGGAYGAMINLGYLGANLSAAFNVVDSKDDKSITLGYGGGPYFTSMEEMTIGGVNDVQAYVLGFDYALLDVLSFHYAYGSFVNDTVDIKEHDIVLSYARDDWDLELSYAMLDDQFNVAVASSGYKRFLLRANYNFKTEQ